MRATQERVRPGRTGAGAARRPSRARELAVRWLPPVAIVVLGSAFLPALPIFLGVLLLVGVGLHVWVPDLRDPFETFLGAPLAQIARVPGGRRGLALTVSAGLVLILGGSVGATLGGHLRSERGHRERERAVEEERWDELVERARGQLAAGEIDAAELTLLELDARVAPPGADRDEVDRLLERVSRSGDPDTILALLRGLAPDELRALEEGSSVPLSLDFGDPALNRRALRLALVLMDEARAQRARH